jgi:hypothetical protein
VTTDAWAACLDRLEAHLRDQRAAIESGAVQDLDVFVPDAGLGPLPVEHGERARQLHEENEALTALVGAARDRVAAALARAGSPAGETVSATFLDARG